MVEDATIERWDRLLGHLERLVEKVDRLATASGHTARPDISLFQRYIAFRWDGAGKGGSILPLEFPHLVDLADLVGIDYAKEELIRNTDQFVAGYPANNLLLWGERGTGKSSCIKGLLRMFAHQGLRIIEVQRGDLLCLPSIISIIRSIPLRFIIFCDDLSFGEGDSSYQELKTLLDGGLEERPENILIYATSNRRHLMPEPMNDNLGTEIHPEEAVSDKLSLADRFGIALSFYPFNQELYLAVVEHHAVLKNLVVNDELRRAALQWALSKGQRSGRAARQFVDDLAGKVLTQNKSKSPTKNG